MIEKGRSCQRMFAIAVLFVFGLGTAPSIGRPVTNAEGLPWPPLLPLWRYLSAAEWPSGCVLCCWKVGAMWCALRGYWEWELDLSILTGMTSTSSSSSSSSSTLGSSKEKEKTFFKKGNTRQGRYTSPLLRKLL